MKNSQKANLLRGVIKKTNKYTGLWINPDFQAWRNDIVRKKLKDFEKKILNQDVTTEEGQKVLIRNIMAYQALKYETDDIFKIKNSIEELAVKKLKKINQDK